MDRKICEKITNFCNFFLEWVGPDPLILGWAAQVQPSEQWSTLHYSHAM